MSKNTKNQPQAKKKVVSAPESFFTRMENRLQKNGKKIFVFCSILCLLFSVLLFNARISEGGDDSTYILAGYKYIKEFPTYYFSFNAPFYPMFLSIPIYFFGINVILLKTLSILFTLLHLYFFYRAFTNRIPRLILFSILFFISINSYLLYFASQTYNEAFFLFFQALFLVCFFNLLESLENSESSVKSVYNKWLLVGLTAFIVTLTKNMAIMLIPAMVLYFLLKKQWKNSVIAVIAFAVCKGVFELIKFLVWGASQQYKGQGGILLLKDPYNPSAGEEDLAGFIARFFENIPIYLSKRFFQILGFMSERSTIVSMGIALLVVALVLFGIIKAFRNKNNYVLFSGIYATCYLGVMFIVLQTRWDSSRLLLVQVPLLLLVIFYGLYEATKNYSMGRNIFIAITSVVLLSSFISTFKKTKENIPILSKNLKGDIYYGYTPDWVNYLRLSEWCAKNLPDTSLVAARKAPMSFIYGNGKEFYPVYKVLALDTTTNLSQPDSLLAILKKDKVTHILMANLRRDPDKSDGTYINTIHRMVQPIIEKYPQKIKLIRQEGRFEPAYLYELNY